MRPSYGNLGRAFGRLAGVLACLMPLPSLAQPPCVGNALEHSVGVSTPLNTGVAQSYHPALTLPTGTYRYTYTTAGAMPFHNVGLVLNGTTAWAPVASTFLPSAPHTISFSFYIPTAQPVCSSKTLRVTFQKQAAFPRWLWVTRCNFNLNVVVVENGERRNLTFVKGVSRAYYAGNDGYVHSLTWTPGTNTWDYAAVNVLNGWGTVRVAGQMASFDNGSRIFFKANNGRLYNLLKAGSGWVLLQVLTGVIPNVAGNVMARGNNEVVYFGSDNRVHRLLLVGTSWSDQILTAIPPIPTAESIYAAPGGSIFFSRNESVSAVHSGGTVLENISPGNVPWQFRYQSDMLALDDHTVYYKGRDNFIHRYVRTGNTWTFDPMTISPASENNVVLGSGYLVKFPGEERVFYKAGTGRIYNIYRQNGTWYNYSLRDPVTTTAGDLIAAEDKIFYINHDRRVHNFYWANNAWWDVPLSSASPANTRGCIRPYYS